MKNNGSTYIYQLPEEPEYYHNPNEYFLAFAEDKRVDHFNAFLHWHEAVINRRVKEFMELYEVPFHFLCDLKQIYAYTVWQEMQTYRPDDPVVLLQKVRYKILDAWHDFVRTVCGPVTIPKRGTYKRLRQVARLYFAEQDTMPDWELVMKIADQLKLTPAKVWELVYLAHAFRYSVSIDMAPSDDGSGEEEAQDIMNKLPPVSSAEVEYAQWLMGEELMEAISQLDNDEQKILEMSAGICLNCFSNLPQMKYSEIAKELGYPSENSVAKKKAAIMKKLRDRLTNSETMIRWAG